MRKIHATTVAAAGLASLLAALAGVAVVATTADADEVGATPVTMAAAASAARGERLFDGREALRGRLAGHTASLAPGLAACLGCHGNAATASPLEARSAPPLACKALARVHARRGEPPFAYDRDGFCRTLRTGINPNYVVLQRTMPRFEIDPAQCDALWAYLTTQGARCHDER